jgi:uncharacterized membrane protein YfcA
MEITFPVSGVVTEFWLPPLVALVVSFFTSMAGLSGAFVLLPFQMSMLGFTGPAVSPTNLVFNIVAIPSGVLRYVRDGRMVWPLTWVIVLGTVPGVVLGGLLRLSWLLEPRPFKAFVGCVLLYIGLRLAGDVIRSRQQPERGADPKSKPEREPFRVTIRHFSASQLTYEFCGKEYSCGTLGLFLLSLVVGVIGGIYGIGGGAIIAPVLVALYGLPVHTVAGATLMGTFATSVVGVAFYQFASPWLAGHNAGPDWGLGALFGVGGLLGTYCGARLQRFVPAGAIKVLLCVLLLWVACSYIAGFLFR